MGKKKKGGTVNLAVRGEGEELPEDALVELPAGRQEETESKTFETGPGREEAAGESSGAGRDAVPPERAPAAWEAAEPSTGADPSAAEAIVPPAEILSTDPAVAEAVVPAGATPRAADAGEQGAEHQTDEMSTLQEEPASENCSGESVVEQAGAAGQEGEPKESVATGKEEAREDEPAVASTPVPTGDAATGADTEARLKDVEHDDVVSPARDEPSAKNVKVDPVLERAERAMSILDNFLLASANKDSPVARGGGAGASAMFSPGVGGAMRVSPQVKIGGGVDSIKLEGVLCKRGDRWMKKWVDRRVLLQFGIVSYFKLPGTHRFPRAQMVLNPDSWAREVDHFDRDFSFQIGCGLEEDGGLVWTFQARSREESRSWIDAVRAVVASVNPLVHPWGVPGEVACSTLKDALQPRGATDAPVDGEPKISSPFNVQHIASGAAAAVGAAAAAVGVAGSARAGEVDRAHGLSAGSHYKEIETKVLREVTSLHDLTEKDLEEWRDRERNWEGEQRMVAADTAAWVRSLPDDGLEAAARAGGGVGAQGPHDKAARLAMSDAPPKKSGKKRAFLKSLLTGGPLGLGLAHPGGALKKAFTPGRHTGVADEDVTGDTLGELSLTDGPERYAKLAFPELEKEACQRAGTAASVPVDRGGERAACGVLFKMDSFGRPVVDAVLEGGNARAHNEACVREGNGMSRQIVVGDRLLSIDDKPCVGFCSASDLREMLLGAASTSVKLELVHEADADRGGTSFHVLLARGGSGLCVASKDCGTLRPDMQ